MNRFWIIGAILAAVGLVLARIVSGIMGEPVLQAAVFVLGVTLTLAGLGVILFGLNRKSRQNQPKK